MRQEHTMKRILGIIYHSIVLSIFLTITYYGYLHLYPGEQLNIINLLRLCKYITFITMILIQGYFIASTPLQLCKQYTIHSYFYVLVFTYAGVICSPFYIALVIDSTVVTDNKELKSMPLWFNHLCHTIPPFVILLEAFVCQPRLAYLRRSLLVCYIMMIFYNFYMEVSIVGYGFSPYPKLDTINTGYRYMVYLLTWLLVTVFTYLGYGLVRLVNRWKPIALIE
ncbi:hypothetical protein KSF78_0008597 [Schistosoma japonicum]|nr:hypothetical protein KSF78_0008597 [Schistosoma japonicum]